MHHQNVSLQNAPSKRTLLTSLKRSKAGPPQLKRSKKYVLMVHFAVIRFDGASGACQKVTTREIIYKYVRTFLINAHRGRGQNLKFPIFISCRYLDELGPQQPRLPV